MTFCTHPDYWIASNTLGVLLDRSNDPVAGRPRSFLSSTPFANLDYHASRGPSIKLQERVKIAVKVVDLFGNDTMTIVDVGRGK